MIFNLNNKNILFLSPKFLGYEDVIKNYLENLGANVVLYDERPSTNSIIKALIRINPNILTRYSRKYFLEIFKKEKNHNFDYIFIIKGEAISSSIILEMKDYYPKSKLIFYSWDSIKNVKHMDQKIKLFDKAFSFDREDCKNFKNLSYLPLFYSQSLTEKLYSKKNDIAFIASLHSDRFDVLQRILANINLSKSNLSKDIFLFYPSKLFFILRKIFDKNFRNIPINTVQWTPLSQDNVISRIMKANIVVDINHPNQSGLTMRTIEAVALNKKIITTNFNIIHEDFYDEDNILLIDRFNPKVSKEFIEAPYKHTDSSNIKEYELELWLKKIFND